MVTLGHSYLGREVGGRPSGTRRDGSVAAFRRISVGRLKGRKWLQALGTRAPTARNGVGVIFKAGLKDKVVHVNRKDDLLRFSRQGREGVPDEPTTDPRRRFEWAYRSSDGGIRRCPWRLRPARTDILFKSVQRKSEGLRKLRSGGLGESNQMKAILERESSEMEDELVILDGKWMNDTNDLTNAK
ncbi:hypothetical protein Tco_1160095 [Tanacetum coccineum]